MSKKYLSNKELYKEIVISKEMGILTRDAKKMIKLLGDKLISKFSYQNPLLKEDCLSEGYFQVFKNWHLFDENKSDNAFAYFTEIYKRGFAHGFNLYNRKMNGEYIKDVRINGFYENGEDLNL